MKIRPAHHKDAQDIAQISNALIRDTLITFTTCERSAAQVAVDIIERGCRFLVAEVNGKVVGFATYAPFRAGPGYAHTMEHSIQLTDESHGKGIGRALMEQLENVARDDGVHVLVAAVSAANPGGVAFHKAIGFEPSGRMPQVGFKAGQRLDLVLMQKIVGKGCAGADTVAASE